MTAKTYEEALHELRVLENRRNALLDNGNYADVSHLDYQIELKRYEVEQEHWEEIREEALAEATLESPQLIYEQYIAARLEAHSNWIMKNIFDDKSGFKEVVFPEHDAQGRTRDEQAIAWTEERTENAEKTLAAFKDNKGEFETILTKIDEKYGEEESMILISQAFNNALTCQQNDLLQVKDIILKNEEGLTKEEIYKKFAELTEGLDANVQADLKQELEYILMHEIAVKKAGEELQKSSKWNELVQEATCIKYVDKEGNTSCLKDEEAKELLCFIVDGRMMCTAPGSTREEKLEHTRKMLDLEYVVSVVKKELGEINCSERKGAYLFSAAGVKNADFSGFKNVATSDSTPKPLETSALSFESAPLIPVGINMVTEQEAPTVVTAPQHSITDAVKIMDTLRQQLTTANKGENKEWTIQDVAAFYKNMETYRPYAGELASHPNVGISDRAKAVNTLINIYNNANVKASPEPKPGELSPTNIPIPDTAPNITPIR